MFLFDFTTLAILAPSLIMWSLVGLAWNRRGRLYRGVLLADRPIQHPALRRHSEVYAQFRVYGLSLVVAAILCSVFTVVNFWHASLQFTIDGLLPSLLILSGYVLLGTAASLLVFLPLQLALQQRLTLPSQRGLIGWSVMTNVLLFFVVAMVALPVFCCFESSLGILPLSELLAKDVFRIGVALSTIPSSLLGMMTALGPLKCRGSLSFQRMRELQSYAPFLKNENFDIALISEKADRDIDNMIELAKFQGQLDKADLLSRILLEKQMLEK